jgi:hypothetical protein
VAPEVRTYWQTFGDQIGAPIQMRPSAAIAELAELRGVRARRLPVQADVSIERQHRAQRLDGERSISSSPPNVFIYYDRSSRRSAMSNVEAMLKPGAFLTGERLSTESEVDHDSSRRDHDDALRAPSGRQRERPRFPCLVQSARELTC